MQVSQLEGTVQSLKSELVSWRSGISVSESEWFKFDSVSTSSSSLAIPADLETAPNSKNLADPILADEREEFLRRENDLVDSLAEKESELKSHIMIVESLTKELAFIKKRDAESLLENKALTASVNEYKLLLEKSVFDNEETLISLDTIKEAKIELEAELESLKTQLQELATNNQHAVSKETEHLKKKQSKMAKMMSEFKNTDSMDEKEQLMRSSFAKLSHLEDNSPPPPTDPELISAQHYELIEAKASLAKLQETIDSLTEVSGRDQAKVKLLEARKQEVEEELSELRLEYEQLLQTTIEEEEQHATGDVSLVIEDLKQKLELQYSAKRHAQEQENEHMKLLLAKKDEELLALQGQVTSMKSKANELSLSEQMHSFTSKGESSGLDNLRQTMGQQLAEFDTMKKKLMRDLQNRCEKVVELELSLEETKDQYNSILRNSNTTQQQQKMSFLERNLEQLSNVQKRLVEQNSSLKKQSAVDERKLANRNERIIKLEALLAETQSKMEQQALKFEAQMVDLREKVPKDNNTQWGSWMQSSRIAKPLRGGVAAAVEPDVNDSPRSSLSLSGNNSKRSSWYVSLLKK
jgi:kinesin family member 5